MLLPEFYPRAIRACPVQKADVITRLASAASLMAGSSPNPGAAACFTFAESIRFFPKARYGQAPAVRVASGIRIADSWNEAATARSQATVSVRPSVRPITDNQPAVRESHQFDIALPTSPWQHTSTLFKQA
jgi:hypothetical protein